MKTLVMAGKTIILDDADYDDVSKYRWFILKTKGRKTIYFCRNVQKGEKRTLELLHRYIMRNSITKELCFVDHINHDGLDLRRENLRVCNRSENARNSTKRNTNTSGYKGVSWRKDKQKWAAQIKLDGKKIHIGLYLTREEAAIAYNSKAIELHGKYAMINIIKKDYSN